LEVQELAFIAGSDASPVVSNHTLNGVWRKEPVFHETFCRCDIYDRSLRSARDVRRRAAPRSGVDLSNAANASKGVSPAAPIAALQTHSSAARPESQYIPLA